MNSFRSKPNDLHHVQEEEKHEPPASVKKISLRNKRVIKFHDPSLMKKHHVMVDIETNSNPVTEKFFILTRTEDDALAKTLTPNAQENEQILSIIEKPDFSELSHKEKHILWKYRYPLKNDERYKSGIVKFLRSVDWERRKEKNEALEMLNEWEINLEHAVPMLSALFSSNDTYPPSIKSDC